MEGAASGPEDDLRHRPHPHLPARRRGAALPLRVVPPVLAGGGSAPAVPDRDPRPPQPDMGPAARRSAGAAPASAGSCRDRGILRIYGIAGAADRLTGAVPGGGLPAGLHRAGGQCLRAECRGGCGTSGVGVAGGRLLGAGGFAAAALLRAFQLAGLPRLLCGGGGLRLCAAAQRRKCPLRRGAVPSAGRAAAVRAAALSGHHGGQALPSAADLGPPGQLRQGVRCDAGTERDTAGQAARKDRGAAGRCVPKPQRRILFRGRGGPHRQEGRVQRRGRGSAFSGRPGPRRAGADAGTGRGLGQPDPDAGAADVRRGGAGGRKAPGPRAAV